MNVAQRRETDGRPCLSVFAPKNSMPMEEALLRADKMRIGLAPNKLLSGADNRNISEAFPCWTGTLFAYESPGKKLDKYIEYLDTENNIQYVWPVPEVHVGARGIALIAEHPGFFMDTDRGTRIIRAYNYGIIERFPASDGWYLGDARYGIPSGDSASASNPEALHLWRVDRMVSLVVRGYGDTNYPGKERLVNMGARPSDRLGAVTVDLE